MWNNYDFGDHSERFLIHCIPYDALVMKSVECMTFKVPMVILYQEVKLYPWPMVPVIKHFMRRIEHRGEVKWNSENLA